jgi:hypothetical protein
MIEIATLAALPDAVPTKPCPLPLIKSGTTLYL